MAKVYTRNGKLWIGFFYKGVQCRESLKLIDNKANLKHADRLALVIQHEIDTQQFNYRQHFPNSKRCALFDEYKPVNITVEQALKEWLEITTPTLSPSTARDYQSAIDCHLNPNFGDLMLKDLQARHIKAWVAKQSELSNKRINNVLIPLRRMLDDAFIDGKIERNPAEKVKNLSVNQQEPNPFSPEEIKRILDNCTEVQHKNLFQFAFFTGLRTGELIALRWEDVDENKKQVSIRRSTTRKHTKAPKTKAGWREVDLTPMALEALLAQKKYTRLFDGHIFHNPRTDSPWETDAQIRKTAWKHILARAGVRYRYPYQTRHTFACLMLTAGENPAWIAQQMGHSDWSMIRKVYARWMPSAAPDAGAKFNAMWEAQAHSENCAEIVQN